MAADRGSERQYVRCGSSAPNDQEPTFARRMKLVSVPSFMLALAKIFSVTARQLHHMSFRSWGAAVAHRWRVIHTFPCSPLSDPSGSITDIN